MDIPAQVINPNIDNPKEEIKFMNEYKLNLENINYLIKIGKITNEIEELIIIVKIESLIDKDYFQNIFSLENLHNMNKIFRQFDTIDEIIESLKAIISEKKIAIKKENDKIFIIFKFKKLVKGEEEINFILKKNSIENGKIIDSLISNITNLKSEVENLKNLINLKKIKKYSPILENGWKIDPYTPQEFIVCKNNDGLVSIQGVVEGDWSKKIFTLEKEFRSKYRLTFPVIAAQAFNRVDILPNGDVYLSFHASLGVKGYGWVNFSGITYYISE